MKEKFREFSIEIDGIWMKQIHFKFFLTYQEIKWVIIYRTRKR